MKKLFILILVSVSFVALSCNKSTSDQMNAAKTLTAKVSLVMGQATILRANTPGKIAVKIGLQLLPEDVVMTGPGSKLNITLKNSGVVRVGQNSKIIMSSLLKKDDGNSEQKINVQAGKIILGLKKLQKNSSFDVETPTAVAGVRGTSFMVDVQENENNAFPYFVKVNQKKNITTKVAVLAGAVEFSTPEGEKPVMVKSLKEATLQGSDFDNIKIVDIKRLSLEQLNEIKDFAEIKKLKMNEITAEISEVEPEVQEMLQTDLKTTSTIKKAKTSDMQSKEKQLKDSIKMQDKKIEKVKTSTKRDGKYLEDSSAW